MDSNHYITFCTERKKGQHLTLEERGAIKALHKQGLGVRAIARNIGYSPSTISYEFKRGTPIRKSSKGRTSRYSPKLARIRLQSQ